MCKSVIRVALHTTVCDVYPVVLQPHTVPETALGDGDSMQRYKEQTWHF